MVKLSRLLKTLGTTTTGWSHGLPKNNNKTKPSEKKKTLNFLKSQKCFIKRVCKIYLKNTYQ